jgi:hypothetical protein
MGEIDAIVGIYGAVDRAVSSSEEARARVARVLPLYRDRNLRWYDEFEGWLRRSSGRAAGEPLFPALPDALAELRPINPKCRMRARRLFALAVAIRALPELRQDSDLRSLAIRTLTSDSLAGKEDTAEQLYELLGDDSLLLRADGETTHSPDAWWEGLVLTAVREELIPSATGMRRRPCSGQLVRAPGVKGPVAALKTDYVTDEVDFEAATHYIDPRNWQPCMPWFWCRMAPLGGSMRPGEERYHEIVSSDCDLKERASFYAETELLFNFTWLPEEQNPEVAIANYQLCNGRPHPGDLIRVDEGTLVVAKVGPGQRPVRVTTTKRIRFSHGFSPRQIAMSMCALGYANISDALLCCAANREGDRVAFDGASPAVPEDGAHAAHGAARRPRPRRRAAVPRAAPAPAAEVEGAVSELVEETVEVWARSLRRGLSWLEGGAGSRRAGARGRRRDRSEG